MNNVLLNNFLDLCKIPHTSGNEEKLRNYLKLRFENGGIKAKIDKVGNLYAHTPATKGYEKRPTICLQAHLDMVGSKTKKSKHNFKTDPIQVSIKNGILKANNTTLGGDDGGGVAMIVTVLEDKQIQHGPLEALFTIEEETTTIGAIKLEKNVLQAKYLFNIDGEGDDTITIGSGGGEDIECYIKPKLVTTKGQTVLISLFKLLSGHSGGDIHLNRLNAIIEVFKCLNKLSNKYEIQLCNAQGGMAKNVIPGFCDIYVNVNDNQAKNFINDAKKYLINLKKINRKNEPNLEFKVTLTKTRNKAINTKDTNKIVDFISNVTNGKIKYDKKYKVVSESANLGIIKFDNGSLTLEWLNRGETFKNIKDIQNKIISLIKTNKWSFKRLNLTAPWQPTIDGKLLNKILEIYKNNFHKTPKVEVIPGVLESGEILSKYPKMSAISIGPNLHDVHTPNERMELKSFYFVYNVLCSILSKIN